MTFLYKLTYLDNKTRNATLWGEGITNTVDTCKFVELCSSNVIHAYTSPHIAVLLNCIHAKIKEPKLWLAEGEVVANAGAKVGCRSLTTIREIDIPIWTLEMKVEFAIRCALTVYKSSTFVEWVNKWLSGEDRSKETARTTAAICCAIDNTYNDYDDRMARYAARDSAYAAVHIAYAVSYAANTAYYATRCNSKVDIVKIAEEVYVRNL